MTRAGSIFLTIFLLAGICCASAVGAKSIELRVGADTQLIDQTLTGEAVGMIDDAQGSILGFYKAFNPQQAAGFNYATAPKVFEWSVSRFTGYGALPGYWTPGVEDTPAPWQSFGWRGKRMDVTGFYAMGARYYEPNSGRFISPDPLGHDASMGLYDYAGGDPINFVDPQGRSAVNIYASAVTSSSYYSDPFGGKSAEAYYSSISSYQPPATVSDWANAALDLTQGFLGVAAYVPAVGFLADLGNSVISYGRGDFAGADHYANAAVWNAGATLVGGGLGALGKAAARIDTGLASAAARGSYIGGELQAAKSLPGSGPAKGILEVSNLRKSSNAFQNYNPGKPVEFVFDTKTQRFVVGNGTQKHSVLRQSIDGSADDVVGGMFTRGNDGSIIINEHSGTYWQNWDKIPGSRNQIGSFLETMTGQKVTNTGF